VEKKKILYPLFPKREQKGNDKHRKKMVGGRHCVSKTCPPPPPPTKKKKGRKKEKNFA
jgi:hypothetical protein